MLLNMFPHSLREKEKYEQGILQDKALSLKKVFIVIQIRGKDCFY